MAKAPNNQPHEIKRRLLEQAVGQNVEHLTGERRPSARARRSNRRGPARSIRSRSLPWIAAGLALAVAAGVAALRSTPELAQPSDERAAATVSSEAPAVVPRPAEETASFAAPVPIDTQVLPLAVRHVVLDPGHGGDDHGASAHRFAEKELTLDLAVRLRELLREEGLDVSMTRDEDRTLTLRERAEFANTQGADLFVSVHLNWIVEYSVRGIETYYLGTTDDPELDELARKENRDSGYSRDEMEAILDGLYAGVRREQSSELAARVQRSLVRSLRRVNPELVDRGVKTAPFVVLGATEMPAILAEVSCLSNRDEVELLKDPEYRDHIARALHRGIQSYASHVNQTEEQGS